MDRIDSLAKQLDVLKIRQDFPILHQRINDQDLIYFDNAATTQKPLKVIKALAEYYEYNNSNVHRGVHTLSVRATSAYESARSKVKKYINASFERECIFVRGTTEAINLVAQSYVAALIQAGEEILITHMEHHSNIVPWQLLCHKTGAVLKVAPISFDGEILLEEFAKKLTPKTRFVAINYASNALGTINPVKEMIALAHAHGAKVLVDGAQSSAHLPIDVQDLNCDFYAFSGHKMYGPTGIGVLWGKEEYLNDMPPYQGGGEMIQYVSFEQTEFASLPYKFEAGTPNIAGAIGLGSAIDYLASLDWDVVSAYETELLNYASNKISSIDGFKIIGTASFKVPVISFVHNNIHAHDVGTIMDSKGVALRSGHHCAMPLMEFYGLAATSRISLSFYNTQQEIDRCIDGLHQVNEVFA